MNLKYTVVQLNFIDIPSFFMYNKHDVILILLSGEAHYYSKGIQLLGIQEKSLVTAVYRLDNAICCVNHYQVDSVIYPLDVDLSWQWIRKGLSL